MLKCNNCNGPIDENAAACPRCGRPGAGKEAANSQATGCLVVVVAVVGFLIYSSLVGGDKKSQEQPAQTTTYEQPSTISSPPPTAIPVSAPPREEPTEPAPQNNLSIDSQETPSIAAGDFPFEATLVDSRGKIVLQSKASVISKNISVLVAGTSVKAESTSGKWIRVMTSDGLVGYVREKQLQFGDGRDQL